MTHQSNDRHGEPDYERDIAEILRQAGASFHGDPQALAAGGLRRGRARLWRRRAGAVTGTAAAVAAIAVAVPQFTGGSGEEPGPVTVAKTETGEDLVRELTRLLPADWEIEGRMAEGPDLHGDPWVTVTADDGAGPFDVSVSLTRYTTEDWRDLAGCVDMPACEERELPDGQVLSTFTEGYAEDMLTKGTVGGGGTEEPAGRSWTVWLEGPRTWAPGQDGMWQVEAVLDSERAADVAPGATPPLGFDQLTELAQAPVWQDLLEVVTAEHGPPEDDMDWVDEYADVPPEQLGTVFRSLAPGLTVVAERPVDAGHVSLDIDDGQGPVTLEVTAYEVYDMQPSDDSTAFDPGELTGCEVGPLEGGGEVETCAFTPAEGDPYGVWSVTAVRPDGSAVSLFEMNGTEDQEQPTRGEGPLSLAELTELAGDEAWTDLLAGE